MHEFKDGVPYNDVIMADIDDVENKLNAFVTTPLYKKLNFVHMRLSKLVRYLRKIKGNYIIIDPKKPSFNDLMMFIHFMITF